MRAAQLHGIGDLRIADVPDARPEAGEELVRIDAVGLCGSDLHWFTEGAIGDAQLVRPLVLGHEIGATIVLGPRAGQRVAVDPAIPCWSCPSCRRGNANLCTRVRFAGHGQTDGALREQMAWPAERLHPVPDCISDEAVPVLEPLGVALHALDLAHARIGDTVGIVGCGPIGLLAIQAALAMGTRLVVASEPLAHRRAIAADSGALAVAPEDVVAFANEASDGEGLDSVIEIAGTDAAVESALNLARPGGRVVLAGIPDGDHTTFTASVARRKGLTLALCRRMKETYPRAIALAATGRVDLTSVISHRFPLAEAPAAFGFAAERTGSKVLILPSF